MAMGIMVGLLGIAFVRSLTAVSIIDPEAKVFYETISEFFELTFAALAGGLISAAHSQRARFLHIDDIREARGSIKSKELRVADYQSRLFNLLEGKNRSVDDEEEIRILSRWIAADKRDIAKEKLEVDKLEEM